MTTKKRKKKKERVCESNTQRQERNGKGKNVVERHCRIFQKS